MGEGQKQPGQAEFFHKMKPIKPGEVEVEVDVQGKTIAPGGTTESRLMITSSRWSPPNEIRTWLPLIFLAASFLEGPLQPRMTQFDFSQYKGGEQGDDLVQRRGTFSIKARG